MLGIIHKTLISQAFGFDKTQLAYKILPFIIPLSIENNLNVTQVRGVVYGRRGLMVPCNFVVQSVYDGHKRYDKEDRNRSQSSSGAVG